MPFSQMIGFSSSSSIQVKKLELLKIQSQVPCCRFWQSLCKLSSWIRPSTANQEMESRRVAFLRSGARISIPRLALYRYKHIPCSRSAIVSSRWVRHARASKSSIEAASLSTRSRCFDKPSNILAKQAPKSFHMESKNTCHAEGEYQS